MAEHEGSNKKLKPMISYRLNQKSLQTHYIRTTGGLLPRILKDAEKVIVEEVVLSEKAIEVDKTAEVEKAMEVNPTMDNDEDLEAKKYPLV